MREIQDRSHHVQRQCECTGEPRAAGACGTCADRAHEVAEHLCRAAVHGAPSGLARSAALRELNRAIAARVGHNILRDLGAVLAQLPEARR